VLVCINRTSRVHPLLKKADKFCVNILHTENAAVSGAFSSPMSADEKFGVGEWRAGPHGVPCLADAQACLVCEKEMEVEYGSHTVFIGRVIEAEIREDVSPLLYSNGKYAACAPLEQ
jgi:flavin reductase (DIM6/NTAB) family NADH-FMN oxidoreductase RutF